MSLAPTPSRPNARRAFTLIETVTALAISSILLLAMASTVVVAAQAIPTGTEAVITEGQIERGLARIASDIEVATDIEWGTKLELTVPDRDGDLAEDVIVYDWSAGDRNVTRTRNSGASEELFGPVSMGNVVLTEDDDDNVQQVIIVFVIPGQTPAARVINVRTLNRP